MSGECIAFSRHAFVAMPFGVKEGIDFNAVYASFIRPALELAGFEVLRADEEETAGNIRLDMFQELLLADLVLVDLTIDNPNVWYELGVRHALRARGIVHVSSRTGRTPFDVATDRQFRYTLVDGAPDPEQLDRQVKALARVAESTIESWRGRNISPIYTLLPYLEEPEWKCLRVGASNEFWEQYEGWEQRIEVAGKRLRAGDILVLADETPTQHLRLEAHRTAAKALVDAGKFEFAKLQIDRALAVDPDDLRSARLKGLILGRTGRIHAAEPWLRNLLDKYPGDPETLAHLGRVRKQAWVDTWCDEDKSPEERRDIASDNDGIMLEALDAYRQGFASDPRHYYSGINALTMLRLYEHVSLDTDTYAELGSELEGGLRWSLASALENSPDDPWIKFTRGELFLLSNDASAAVRSYKTGVARTRRDWFALDAVRQQLHTFELLEFRPDIVASVSRVVSKALERLRPPWKPRRIFLFSGHMVDRPDREQPRFPDHPAVIAEARARICAWLDERGACEEDLALSSAACGSDLLFAEAALERKLKLDIRLPFSRAEFLRRSVAFAGAYWVEAFHRVTTAPETKLRIMSKEIGPTPKGFNEFARNNLWMLYSALSGGAERLEFLCLWNGKAGDGPGGTQDMVDTIRQHAGFADIIDSNELLKALPGNGDSPE
ncbi:MAG: tetratricopeptide repeat protein [Pseudomonadota bacterium]